MGVLYVNVDGDWVEVPGGAEGPPGPPGGVTTLDGLTDVNAPSPSDNQSLTWDAASAKWVAETVTGGGGGAPSGAAGGALGGTYPNPTLSTTKQAELDAKAPKANAVFTGTVTVPDGALAIADTAGLQTALDAVASAAQLADQDTFTRADVVNSTIGFTERYHRPWQSAGWSITSGRLHRHSGYGLQFLDGPTSAVIIEVQVAAGATGEWYVITRMSSDFQDYIRAGVSGGGAYVFQVVDHLAGGGLRPSQFFTTVNAPPTPANGDVLKVITYDNDGWDVFINDVQIWTGGDDANVASRLYGVAASGNTARFEYLKMTPIPGGISRLGWMVDVDTTGVTDGAALTWDTTTSKWIPATLALGGTPVVVITESAYAALSPPNPSTLYAVTPD